MAAHITTTGGDRPVLMTLRVSRDSGRSWGPVTVVHVSEGTEPPLEPMRFPPCCCRLCQSATEATSAR
ncbi:hypothetical protein B7R87_17145 [Streptomyces tsukubensis]|uniref:Exo-alpha-sialidase n=1 Tax=Streptomyces tsukubensis (strain DSM 42081 / NBRC 108919 / NRRL 18488 / 9993) TaxID=1114943 RepID=A0A7G3UI15_STRT9|nr:hypothetical protein B7R87_17145 [Streptomyces tsukubensis]QKM68562.1 hypothetical protein STSU_016645 [Streptomyces tsukubensis NRRL18488]TAI43370.1 hypothetical protein EWI31_16410 [Streptomyces tsukubensis]